MREPACRRLIPPTVSGVDWLEILLPLACAFAVGVIADSWWAVLVTLVVGVAGYAYASYATDDATLGAAVRLVLQWVLATVAGVVVRRGVQRAVTARRDRSGPQSA